MIDTIKTVFQAILVALGLAEKISDAATAPKPELMPAPPPADKDALDRELHEIHKQKWGK